MNTHPHAMQQTFNELQCRMEESQLSLNVAQQEQNANIINSICPLMIDTSCEEIYPNKFYEKDTERHIPLWANLLICTIVGVIRVLIKVRFHI